MGIEFDLLPWSQKQGVSIMAYSPVEQGRILKNPALAAVAQRHKATPAQQALRGRPEFPDRRGRRATPARPDPRDRKASREGRSNIDSRPQLRRRLVPAWRHIRRRAPISLMGVGLIQHWRHRQASPTAICCLHSCLSSVAHP